MSALADFQTRFAAALQGGAAAEAAAAGEAAALARQAGFAVYRNTVMKACIDAVAGNYPSVRRLVGEDWFRAAAAVYVETHPLADPRMLYYGADFPQFLAGFAPAAQLAYLPHVARLDRYWTEAHGAMDEPVLDPAALAGLQPDALGATVLCPHPSARWAWFDDQPVYTIWKRNREPFDEDGAIDWRPEGALILRPAAAVLSVALDAAGCAFLDACRSGRPLAEAAGAALAVQEDADLAQLMTQLLHAGAFSRSPVGGSMT